MVKKHKLSLNIVKTEFTESTPYTIVVEGQEVKRVELNNKWSVVALVTALASRKNGRFRRLQNLLPQKLESFADLAGI